VSSVMEMLRSGCAGAGVPNPGIWYTTDFRAGLALGNMAGLVAVL
jgi:hypothetical protein